MLPGLNGFINEVSYGGMLGTIKDEDSNADSDFSGDDGTPSNIVSSKLDPQAQNFQGQLIQLGQ